MYEFRIEAVFLEKKKKRKQSINSGYGNEEIFQLTSIFLKYKALIKQSI